MAGLIAGSQRFWLLTCALPTIAFPLVLAALDTAYDDGLRNQLLVWLLALPVFWQFLYAQRHSALLRLGSRSPRSRDGGGDSGLCSPDAASTDSVTSLCRHQVSPAAWTGSMRRGSGCR